MAGACRCGNVPTVSIKFGEFFINLGPVTFFRKYPALHEFRKLTALSIIRKQKIYSPPPLLQSLDCHFSPVYSLYCLAALNVQYLVETTATEKKRFRQELCHFYVARNTLIVVTFLSYFFLSTFRVFSVRCMIGPGNPLATQHIIRRMLVNS
jgi:hypothetical protein